MPETGAGTSVRDQGIKRLGNYELTNKMNKLQLVPPSPPKTKNGKLVWQKQHEEFLKDACKAGLTTGSAVRNVCGAAWKEVEAKKITRKMCALGLKADKNSK